MFCLKIRKLLILHFKWSHIL